MIKRLGNFLGLSRPRQLYKLGIIWLPGLFHGKGSLEAQFRILLIGSVVWWITTTIVYILNDIHDLPEDRLRPERIHRPLASGRITPWEALLFGTMLLGVLLYLLPQVPIRVSWLLGGYTLFNLGYTFGLKNAIGVRQVIIAIGFWFRLQSGAFPVSTIPLSPWASLFTLGLAYYLNCLKGLTSFGDDRDRGFRFSMAIGAGLAGSLALVSLVSICLKRGQEGQMNWPVVPPILCLLGMHRAAYASFKQDSRKEQSDVFFFDWANVFTMIGFIIMFLY